MKNPILAVMALIACLCCYGQQPGNLVVRSIEASEPTGQDYTPWLSDDLTQLVSNAWGPDNQKYIDVTLRLAQPSTIVSLSLYDYEGVFTDKPAQLYAQQGTRRTLIGTFSGDRYGEWITLSLPAPVAADAVVVHKYGNNIPQKIKISGYAGAAPAPDTPTQKQTTRLTFGALPPKSAGDPPFLLPLSSNNQGMPIQVRTSDSSVVAVTQDSRGWMATIGRAGTATLTATQDGDTNYLPAQPVTQTVQVAAGTTLPPGAEERIPVVSVSANIETGQDYSSWLSDDLQQLVPKSWDPRNNQVVQVTLKLARPALLSRLSLFDGEGIFTDRPAQIYAQEGSTRTLLGHFAGTQYNQFVDLVLNPQVRADAIVVEKWGNNLPQKVQVFGRPVNTVPPDTTAPVKQPSVLSFASLPVRTAGGAAFEVPVSSNNRQTPIRLRSTDTAVVALRYTNGRWMAYPRKEGQAELRATQAASANYLAAQAVTRVQVVAASRPGQGKIPILAHKWYQLTNATGSLAPLFDGNTDQKVATGWGKLLPNYYAYYPLAPTESWTIEEVRFYDGEGSTSTEPMTLSVITSKGDRIPIARFTGSQYNTWVGPNPDQPHIFRLPKPISDIRYLEINCWNFFPTEIALYGSYQQVPQPAVATPVSLPLAGSMGINAFEWDFLHPQRPDVIDEQKLKAFTPFTGVRHYLDWERLESREQQYTFNPTHSGGWNYDALYERCRKEGLEVLACIKTLPSWLLATYPAAERDNENIPMRYGMDPAQPASYIEQARMGFQFAARYGANKSVPANLVKVDPSLRWNGDKPNEVKTGLNLIRYIECENERDKWWKGRKAYQTAYEYAANLSAFYDGHKKTLGADVGVKNADPQMQVVMGGLAAATPEYVRGMIEWCRQHRGYRPDGSIDVCWDVLNFHLYANDARTSQGGQSTRGAAPELAEPAATAMAFRNLATEYGLNMPLWVTEAGYDLNQGSPLKAIPIGSKDAAATQADWIMRTALLYNRVGVERVFFYQLYDDNPQSPIQFGSSGLINYNGTRRPAADYLLQLRRLLGSYRYQQTLQSDPLVDRYELEGASAYVLLVPDEKDRKANYVLELPGVTTASVYQPQIGADTMTIRILPVVQGRLSLQVTETPQVVVPAAAGTTARIEAAPQRNLEQQPKEQSLARLFPNPAKEYFELLPAPGLSGTLEVRVVQSATGILLRQHTIQVLGKQKIQVSLAGLPAGSYYVELRQGQRKQTEQLVKQ